MSMCAEVTMLKTEVDSFIEYYESILKDDTLSDVDSADTQEALDSLYSYQKSIDNKDLEFVNAKGKQETDNLEKKSLLESSFKKVLGKDFVFLKGNSNGYSIGTMTSVDLVNGNIKISYTHKGIKKQNTFSPTSGLRSTDNKNKSFINIEKFTVFMTEYNKSLEAYEESNLILGSSDNKVKLGEKFKETDYVHGNLAHMKNMLKRLHLLGGEKAKDVDLDTYLDYMDKMSPKFFNDLELYLEEAGNVSSGTASARRIDIIIGAKEKHIGNQQSEASIFFEEVVHSMTASAMHSKVPESIKLKRQLISLIEQTRNKISWKDFLPSKEESIDSDKEAAYAKWLYDYMFSGKNADYEFLAKALAVPEVSAAFGRIKVRDGNKDATLLSRINDFLSTVIEILSGAITFKQKNQNVHEAVVNLAYAYGEINNRNTRKITAKDSYMDKALDMLNNLDDSISLLSQATKDKVFGKIKELPLPADTSSLYGRVLNVSKFITLSLINPTYTKSMGLLASAYHIKPEGTVREIIGGLFATDSVQRVAEQLGMQSGYIDRQRNDQIDLVAKNVLHKFKDPKKVSKELEEALTSVLSDTELSSLFGNDSITKDLDLRKISYTNKTLRKLLTDDAYLDDLIYAVKRALKEVDRKNYHWHSNQAVGLGVYAATHRATTEQNLNAANIAKGIHSSHNKKSTPRLEKAINELATLVAIKNTNIEERTLVATSMTTEWAGVQHVADVIEGFKKNSDETVFKGRKTNKIKGYSKELFDDSIAIEIAPVADRKQMEAKGFIFKTTLNDRAGEVRLKKMALYVTDSATKVSRVRGAARLNTITSKGTTITSTTYKDGDGFTTTESSKRAKHEIARIRRDASLRANLMETGDYDFKNTIFGLVPVLNDSGDVVDYRYMMDKATKKTMLKQDTRISEVMAKSFGGLVDRENSVTHNVKVLQALKEDMHDNWSSGDVGTDGMTEYSLIGPNVVDSEMRSLYYMLPKEMQTFVNTRADKTLAVRRDLLFVYFGYSNMTLANFPGFQKIAPKIIVKFVKFAEMLWMDLIKIVKTNILVKMPAVLTGNILSNMIQALLNGYNPITVLKQYNESYKDIKLYNKNTKRVQELENTVRELGSAIGRSNVSHKRKTFISLQLKNSKNELEALNMRLKDSPIHELVLLGLDQNVEDGANDANKSSNKLVDAVETRVLNRLPEMVKSGLDIVFITRRTKMYKVANEFLEVSDLIARDVQNRLEKKIEVKQADSKKILPSWWLEKQGSGYDPRKRLIGAERKQFLSEAKQHRHYDLVEDYIAYTKPSGRFEEWLNKVGILMFSKYVKRIQRIIAKKGSKGIIKTLIVAILLGYAGGLSSILDQSMFVKDWYTTSIGAGNVFPIYSAGEHILNAFTPSIIKSSTYDFSI